MLKNNSILLLVLLTSLLLYFPGYARAQSDEYQEAFSAYEDKNFEAAGTLWRKLADEGDANAQYAMGVMKLRGELKKSPELADSNKIPAIDWFMQAAESGHSTAMFNVGVAYWEGKGVARDPDEAIKWWQRSARAGDSGAQFNLGLAYYLGEEQEADLGLAAYWIGLAAEQDHPEAKRIYQILLRDNPELASVTLDAVAPDPVQPALPASVEPEQSSSESETPETDTQEVAKAEPEPEPEPEPVETFEYWKTTGSVNLQSAPGSGGTSFVSIPQETPVEVVEAQGSWLMVTLPDGIRTWIFEKYLQVDGNTGVVVGQGVRIRPLPETNNSTSPPLGAYVNGDRLTVLKKSGQWYQVRAPKNIGGWIPGNSVVKYRSTREDRQALWQQMTSQGL